MNTFVQGFGIVMNFVNCNDDFKVSPTLTYGISGYVIAVNNNRCRGKAVERCMWFQTIIQQFPRQSRFAVYNLLF